MIWVIGRHGFYRWCCRLTISGATFVRLGELGVMIVVVVVNVHVRVFERLSAAAVRKELILGWVSSQDNAHQLSRGSKVHFGNNIVHFRDAKHLDDDLPRRPVYQLEVVLSSCLHDCNFVK